MKMPMLIAGLMIMNGAFSLQAGCPECEDGKPLRVTMYSSFHCATDDVSPPANYTVTVTFPGQPGWVETLTPDGNDNWFAPPCTTYSSTGAIRRAEVELGTSFRFKAQISGAADVVASQFWVAIVLPPCFSVDEAVDLDPSADEEISSVPHLEFESLSVATSARKINGQNVVLLGLKDTEAGSEMDFTLTIRKGGSTEKPELGGGSGTPEP